MRPAPRASPRQTRRPGYGPAGQRAGGLSKATWPVASEADRACAPVVCEGGASGVGLRSRRVRRELPCQRLRSELARGLWGVRGASRRQWVSGVHHPPRHASRRGYGDGSLSEGCAAAAFQAFSTSTLVPVFCGPSASLDAGSVARDGSADGAGSSDASASADGAGSSDASASADGASRDGAPADATLTGDASEASDANEDGDAEEADGAGLDASPAEAGLE